MTSDTCLLQLPTQTIHAHCLQLQTYFSEFETSLQNTLSGTSSQKQLEINAMKLRWLVSVLSEKKIIPHSFAELGQKINSSVRRLVTTRSRNEAIEGQKSRVGKLFQKILLVIQNVQEEDTLSQQFLQALKARTNALKVLVIDVEQEKELDDTNVSNRLRTIQTMLDNAIGTDLSETKQEQLQKCCDLFDTLAQELKTSSNDVRKSYEAFCISIEKLKDDTQVSLIEPEEFHQMKLAVLNQPHVQEIFAQKILQNKLEYVTEHFPVAVTQLRELLHDLLAKNPSQDEIELLLHPNHFLLIHLVDLVRRKTSVFSSELFQKHENVKIEKEGPFQGRIFKDFFENECSALCSCTHEDVLHSCTNDKPLLDEHRNAVLMAFIGRAYDDLPSEGPSPLITLVRLKLCPKDSDLAKLSLEFVCNNAYSDAQVLVSYISSDEMKEQYQEAIDLLYRLLTENTLEVCEQLCQSFVALQQEHFLEVVSRLPTKDFYKALFLAREDSALLEEIVDESFRRDENETLYLDTCKLPEPVKSKVLMYIWVDGFIFLDFETARGRLEKLDQDTKIKIYLEALRYFAWSDSDKAVAFIRTIKEKEPTLHVQFLNEEYQKLRAHIVIVLALENLDYAFQMINTYDDQGAKEILYIPLITVLLQTHSKENQTLSLAKELLPLIKDETRLDGFMQVFFGTLSDIHTISNDELKQVILELPHALQSLAWAHMCYRVVLAEGIEAACSLIDRYCNDQKSLQKASIYIAYSIVKKQREVSKPGEEHLVRCEEGFGMLLDRIKTLPERDYETCVSQIFELFTTENVHYVPMITYSRIAEKKGYKNCLENICSTLINGLTTDMNVLATEAALPSQDPLVQALFQKLVKHQLSLHLTAWLFLHPAVLQYIAPVDNGPGMYVNMYEEGIPENVVSFEFGMELAWRISQFCKHEELTETCNLQELITKQPLDKIDAFIKEMNKIEIQFDHIKAAFAFLLSSAEDSRYEERVISCFSSEEMKKTYQTFKEQKSVTPVTTMQENISMRLCISYAQVSEIMNLVFASLENSAGPIIQITPLPYQGRFD